MRAVAVVIPTCGRPALLDRTLASLAAAHRPARYAGTWVVENGGLDPLVAEIVSRWAAPLGAAHVSMPDGNKSAALNAMLERLGDELIVFLDDDVRVDEGVLAAYVRADEEAAAARVFFGGPTLVDYEVPPPEWLRTYLPPSAVGWQWRGDPNHVDAPEFLGFNWAARAEDLRHVGGFDAAFGPGARTGATGQERDMQRRLLEAGWRGRYVSQAPVWHYVPRDRCSRGWALKRAFRNGVSEGLYSRPEPGPRLAGVPRWMVRTAAGKAVRALGAQFGRSPQARFAAMRDLLLFTGKLKGMRVATTTQGHE